MGLPAVKHDRGRTARRPHLRVVAPAKTARRSPARAGAPSRRPSHLHVRIARRNFLLFTAVVVLFAGLGVGRVWLSVEAAQAAIEAKSLRDDIRVERYNGDMLEVRQSALGSPSRIRAIAGKALGMEPADEVTYLDLTTPEARDAIAPSPAEKSAASAATPSRVAAATATGGESGFEAALASLVDLTAGEASVLLVGDVGLASAR